MKSSGVEAGSREIKALLVIRCFFSNGIHSVLNYASFGELGSAKHACSIWVCQYAKHYSMEISY